MWDCHTYTGCVGAHGLVLLAQSITFATAGRRQSGERRALTGDFRLYDPHRAACSGPKFGKNKSIKLHGR